MLDPEAVCAVLVTRGDVDMNPIVDELPYGEFVIWNNSLMKDLGLWGRYFAIGMTEKPVIYFQDDDCLVRNHQALMDAWQPGHVVGNFRRDKARERYYHDTTLLGWGSLFERHLPWNAWNRFVFNGGTLDPNDHLAMEFTWPVLTPTIKVLVDIKEGGDVEWLRDNGEDVFGRPDRMSQQPGFYEHIDRVLATARRHAQ
jgi:hypothetical protein